MADLIHPERPALGNLPLTEIARLAEGNRLPPVEHWHPAHCGDSEMRIAADGTWFHQGTPIGRLAMVRLFSRILRRESDGSYVLVTPIEKLTIAVDDAPFVALALKTEGEGTARTLAFELNTGDIVVAGPDHPLRFGGTAGEPRPYLHVRGTIGNGLEALLARSVFYELADIGLTDDRMPIRIWSNGQQFILPA